MSKLHIVMVALNNAQMTKEAIDSIQTKEDWVLHFIDQESTELFDLPQNTDYHRFSPRVSLSEAWNYGIRRSLEDKECEYIFVPNNDVVFHRSTLDNLIKGIKNGFDFVTCDNVAPRMSLESMQSQQTHGDFKNDCIVANNWRMQGPDFSGFMLTPNTIQQVGFFDENFIPAYYEDNDYHKRLVLAGIKVKRFSSAPFYHYGSVTAKSVAVNSGKSHAYFGEKWGSMSTENVMDGVGYAHPYNDSTKDHKYWRGVEKYG